MADDKRSTAPSTDDMRLPIVIKSSFVFFKVALISTSLRLDGGRDPLNPIATSSRVGVGAFLAGDFLLPIVEQVFTSSNKVSRLQTTVHVFKFLQNNFRCDHYRPTAPTVNILDDVLIYNDVTTIGSLHGDVTSRHRGAPSDGGWRNLSQAATMAPPVGTRGNSPFAGSGLPRLPVIILV